METEVYLDAFATLRFKTYFSFCIWGGRLELSWVLAFVYIPEQLCKASKSLLLPPPDRSICQQI
jgi:hypothetical protein